MSKRKLVTCGLPYSNGYLHVGHIAGCYLPADIYVRYLRMNQRKALFICGSDDHGVPIKLSAEKENKSPAAVAAFYNAAQLNDFAGLGIKFDIYGATSNSDYHYAAAQDFFSQLDAQGYFTKKVSQQFYDAENNFFLPDRYVKGTCGYCQAKEQNSDQCENCGRQLDVEHLADPYSVITRQTASIKDTAHWYLDLRKFSDTVSQWLDKATIRDQTKSFVSGLIETGLVERAMTRDLDWGVPLPESSDPDAKNKVLYVWFDAPIAYISYTMEALARNGEDPQSYQDWWTDPDSEIIHFIGEDNTVFHCIIWIAMLAAYKKTQLPAAVIVNQFVNIKFSADDAVEKISKSRGNAVWIKDYLAGENNPDSLRYYLNSIAPEKSRSVFNPEDLIQRHNSELANNYGNFVNRVLSFYTKHFGNSVTAPDPSLLDQTDLDLIKRGEHASVELGELIENFQFKNYGEALYRLIKDLNLYIDDRAPWKLKKTDPALTENILKVCILQIYNLAIYTQPLLPFTSTKLLRMLGIEESTESLWQSAGTFPEKGLVIGELEILFNKIETE